MSYQPFLQSALDKLKEPLLPAHLVNCFLSLVLFACVANSYTNINDKSVCGFNSDEGSCSFPWGLGLFAFFLSLVFIAIELRWEAVANYHRSIYVVEMVTAGLLSFVMFVAFCMMASAWSKTSALVANSVGSGNPGVAIACSFLSVFSWAGLCYVSYKGFKEDEISGGMERLGGYVDPVTSYHGAVDPPIP